MKHVAVRRIAYTILALLALTGCGGGRDPEDVPEVSDVLQVVHDYRWSFAEDNQVVNGQAIDSNPFRFYTHIGTDYGRMGPSQGSITWSSHEISVAGVSDWAGMWHSLSGLARELGGINFSRVYPGFIKTEYQPQCIGIVVRGKGAGSLKLELKALQAGQASGALTESTLWSDRVYFNGDEYATVTNSAFTLLSADMFADTKFLSWVVERGNSITVDNIGLLLRFPALTFEKKLFLVSYAKFARCYSENEGVCRDRANFPVGDFDCVPTSGMFCLATALAWRLGIVEKEFADTTLRKIHATVSSLPTAKGVLPHFIRKYDGQYRIHHDTEYSTADTSLYYHGMLAAARILELEDVENQLAAEVESIDFRSLYDGDGHVVHGLEDDGETLLQYYWGDWGGESALVLALEKMAMKDDARLVMSNSGWVYNGVGFIVEVQNLFYRQFGSATRDAVTGQDWSAKRRDMLERQMNYFPSGTPARDHGIYGLSAGEGVRGVGYSVNGVDVSGATLIHPHYMLMSATARDNIRDVYNVLRDMEAMGLLTPLGLVENVRSDLGDYLPMIGSLNSSFECISAYHMWAAVNGEDDAVYEAADSSPLLSEAIRAFYPQ